MNIDTSHLLSEKEKLIYDNLQKVLQLKQITIEDAILIDYIRSHTLTNMYITTDILNKIIKECLDIQTDSNTIENNNITKMPNLGDNNVKVLSSITKNINSDIPKRELREEYIYIKGISGDAGKFTNTFLLNKTFNNVESLELISGYVNDHGLDTSNPTSLSGDHPTDEGIGILNDPLNTINGSIGTIPFIWVDIEEPNIKTYSHYSDYTVNSVSGSCDCSGSSSYISRCGIDGNEFNKCQPHGTFLVELKQYNFPIINEGQTNTFAANLVYKVDNAGDYKKKFNNLISMDKLKINIRNIVGNPLWGSKNCQGTPNTNWTAQHPGDPEGQGIGCENVNLLRWEFIFKVKYYINVLDNTFLIQNS